MAETTQTMPQSLLQVKCIVNVYVRTYLYCVHVSMYACMHICTLVHIFLCPYILSTIFLSAHPPVVSVTPSLIAATEGDSVTFTCLATGVGASNFTYEWLLNGSVINGVTEHSFNITVSENTIGNYTCIVTNQFGGSGQSNIARLTLSKHLDMYVYLVKITFVQSHHFVIQ